MKTKKTYLVRGKMEWHTVFKAGRTLFHISFTGGHSCGGGCTPASFETDDPVVQEVIEHSPEYMHGYISCPENDELCRLRRP